MKKEITIEEMECLLNEMGRLRIQYPKAKVIYDMERDMIYISFPLPSDYLKIRGLKICKIIKDEFRYLSSFPKENNQLT